MMNNDAKVDYTSHTLFIVHYSLHIIQLRFNEENMKTILSIALSVAALTSYGQNPAPAKPQTKPIALTGGVVHIGNGQVIQNGVVLFNNGVITNVVDGTTARLDLNGVEVIDVSGKHVYPGFISPVSTVGLQEISAVRATVDKQEVGDLNPNVRALIAYSTDSEIIPTIRNNGVLFSQATPQGGTISGSSSVMMSDGWNWEDRWTRWAWAAPAITTAPSAATM